MDYFDVVSQTIFGNIEIVAELTLEFIFDFLRVDFFDVVIQTIFGNIEIVAELTLESIFDFLRMDFYQVFIKIPFITIHKSTKFASDIIFLLMNFMILLLLLFLISRNFLNIRQVGLQFPSSKSKDFER